MSAADSPHRQQADRFNAIAAILGLLVIAGLYSDGWAHINIGGLESFFTPWHGLLYGSFTLLTGWIAFGTWNRHRSGIPWSRAVPSAYRLGLVGIGVFGLGGVLDMLWHLVFGVESGIDALVSPTHLILLLGGLLLLSSPLRFWLTRPDRSEVVPWPAVLSTAALAALVGFFLSYMSVFTDPGATVALTKIPEGAPGHQAAELPAVAGLGGYLVTTLLLVVPLIHLRRSGRLPTGAVTVFVASISVPASALSEMEHALSLVGALVGAALIDVFARNRSIGEVAALLPVAVWSGQLAGLAIAGDLAWPVELWAGVIVMSMLAGLALAATTRPVASADLSQESLLSAGPG
ncbi:MAG: hypothetical protein ACR2FE_08685 [Aeromicrobium sp.]